MPMFKVIVEELEVYGCTIEAEDRDEAEEKWEEAFDKLGNYHLMTLQFSEPREYDGSVELNIYDEDGL